MTTAELEVWLNANQPDQAIESFVRALNLESSIDDGATNPAVLTIMSTILNAADDEDAIFAAANAGTMSGKEYTNQPFRLLRENIQWKFSGATYTEQGGFPWYALLKVLDLSTDDYVTLTCGGMSFITTLWKLTQSGTLDKYEDEGGMPLVLTAKPTGSGFNVLLLGKYLIPKSSKHVKSEKA